MIPDRLDLGVEGFWLERVVWRPTQDAESRTSGAWWRHLTPAGVSCDAGSYIGLDPEVNTARACWTVDQADPLSLSPSLLCTRCGTHGFIRSGRWVPA